MCADRALHRSRLADIGVTAVAADPHLLLLPGKDFAILEVGGQLTVALFVLFLDLAHHGEQGSQLVETLFLGLFGHAGVHVGPFVMLAARGQLQAGHHIRHLAAVQGLEPELCVLFLVSGGLLKDGGQLLIACLFGHRGKERVLAAGHALACKCFHQVFLGLAAFQFHGTLLCSGISIPVYRVCGEVIPSPVHSMFLWEYCTTRSRNNQESFLFMACQEFSFVFSHYAV